MNKLDPLRKKILELEAKHDICLFGVYRGPDGKFYREDGTEATGAGDFKTVGGAVKAVGTGAALGGAVAGAGVLAKRYGVDQASGPKSAGRILAAGLRRDAGSAARKAGVTAAGGLGNLAQRAQRVAAVAADSGKKGRGLRRTAGLLAKAATSRIGLGTIKDRVIELASK